MSFPLRQTGFLARLTFNHSHSFSFTNIQTAPLSRFLCSFRTFPALRTITTSSPIMCAANRQAPNHSQISQTVQSSALLPHRLDPYVPIVGPGIDWITPILETHLTTAIRFRPVASIHSHPPRILVLHGTLRERGFSKLLAYECARLLEGLGADVRVYDPNGLPVRDPELQEHRKVVELRSLVEWSEAHVWSASELHGNLCSVFKNQIDWIPLNSGSVRPTQGKSVAILQVCGGSQSFNVANTLRLLARWMRMTCVVNQSSVQKAWKEFDDSGRMKESSMRDRVVDVMEEFIKFARINREYCDILNDRFSERQEKMESGRLLTQAEKEAAKDAALEEEKKNKANE